MKAKSCIKKTLSMIVVLVMLLTMIPVGMISVSAAATIDLTDYDTATEYVITNAEDWAVIAAATDKDFAGKTVKLGADLDFANAAAATLFESFAGTFDGQNYTVSNATVAGNALIADVLVGGATVQNVKFVNIDVTGTDNAGLIAGRFSPKSTGETTTISKVNIDETSSVTAGTDLNAGGFFGVIPNVGTYTLVVENVSAKAAVTGKISGGLFGKEEGNRSHTNAFVNISNSVIAPSSTAIAGIFGYFGGGKVNNPPIATSSMITLNNVVVDATNCTYALYGNCYNHSTTAAGVFVTKDQLIGTISGYANAFNGIHSARNNKISTLAPLAENVPTLISAEVAETAAEFDDDGFVSGLLPKNILLLNAAIGTLNAVVTAEDGIDAAKFAAALENLATNMAAAEAEAADSATDATLAKELKALVDDAKAAREAAVAAVLTNLNAAIADLETAKAALADADQANADALALAVETLNAEIENATNAIAAAAAAATAADNALKAEIATAMTAANTQLAEAIEAIAEELAATKEELAAANKAIEDLKAADKAIAEVDAAQDAAVEDAEAAAKAANGLALTGTIIGGVALVLVIALAVLGFIRRKED